MGSMDFLTTCQLPPINQKIFIRSHRTAAQFITTQETDGQGNGIENMPILLRSHHTYHDKDRLLEVILCGDYPMEIPDISFIFCL